MTRIKKNASLILIIVIALFLIVAVIVIFNKRIEHMEASDHALLS